MVRKQDIFIVKNYLTEDEIDTLNRLVVIFLESAELRVKNRLDIHMSFWKENFKRILESNEQNMLTGPGAISKAQMEQKAAEIYDRFDAKRKAFEAIEADQQDLEDLEKVNNEALPDKDKNRLLQTESQYGFFDEAMSTITSSLSGKMIWNGYFRENN